MSTFIIVYTNTIKATSNENPLMPTAQDSNYKKIIIHKNLKFSSLKKTQIKIE